MAHKIPKKRQVAMDRLESRLNDSCEPNKWLAESRVKDPIAIRQVEIAMYISACAAFERYVHELFPRDPDAKSAYLNWADKKYKTDRKSVYRMDFRAYWAVRDSIMHGAGYCKYLNWRTTGAHKLSRETKSKLKSWKISKTTDLYSDQYAQLFTDGPDDAAGVAKLWRGLVGWIRKHGSEFGL